MPQDGGAERTRGGQPWAWRICGEPNIRSDHAASSRGHDHSSGRTGNVGGRTGTLIKRSLRGAGHNVNWRRGRDSNPRYGYPYAAFRVRCFQPLSHLSLPGARERYLAPRGKRSLNEATGTKQAHRSAPGSRKSYQVAIKATLTTVLRFPRRVVWYRDPKTARVCVIPDSIAGCGNRLGQATTD